MSAAHLGNPPCQATFDQRSATVFFFVPWEGGERQQHRHDMIFKTPCHETDQLRSRLFGHFCGPRPPRPRGWHGIPRAYANRQKGGEETIWESDPSRGGGRGESCSSWAIHGTCFQRGKGMFACSAPVEVPSPPMLRSIREPNRDGPPTCLYLFSTTVRDADIRLSGMRSSLSLALAPPPPPPPLFASVTARPDHVWRAWGVVRGDQLIATPA
ncbi:hypothetical protein F4778DRAFT_331246 [Xylariomycetidae sp. FL2044]|nr:hypothetical protein F4778DRAFT_331246 [Xylariomycetidae sp. FL2044]